MTNKHLIQLQGSISLADLPAFTARPHQVCVTLSRPGAKTRGDALTYQLMAFNQSPLSYRLQVDARTFKAGEALELAAFVTAGYDKDAEKARVTLPLTLDPGKPNVEYNLVIPGRTTLANSSRIAGTLTIPPTDNLADHLLRVGLYEVGYDNKRTQLYHRIVECNIPFPAPQTPFSLDFDETALTYDDTSHDVMIWLLAPNGRTVATCLLRQTTPTELGQNLQITLKKRR
ncbi:hypothetical protein E2H86_06930 [Pseudomonas putida]|uniref:hypothetical protein n=1 Tax=Pseudomonas putida group TaxID=136845 RepID=UPI0010596438|nr:MULTISPECIES: hypothetical protein [Pseudomonas putida group]MBF8746533.1 hypothetical protein [Pseudomonas monteilii]TDJ77694.1 hypothetical protein E2H86_06930 [Pseudomonas putida]